LIGKPEARRPLGIYARRQEYNIKMYLREIKVEIWTAVIRLKIRDQWRAFVNKAMKFLFP
jgi:hypothetical protein